MSDSTRDPTRWTPAPADPLPVRPPRRRRGARFLSGFERFVDAPKVRTAASVVDQLRETMPADRLMGWVVTLVITGLAFFIRWFRLGQPSEILFDETYYAKQAWSLLRYGYEGQWVGELIGESADINARFAQGDFSALSTAPDHTAVHPPLGKWLIAAGMKLFGLNAFGWRFMSLVFGTLIVFVVIRLGRRLSRSTLIGGLAGLLLTVDGLSFVMSRLALLDVFQAFFIVAGVACVVVDRDFFRNRLADHLLKLPDGTFGGDPGPFVFRPWLIGAGLLFGAGCATKWDTVAPLAVFGVLVVVWSVSARRLAGAGRRSWWALVKDGVPAFVSMVVVAAGVYLASWTRWLTTTGGYDRQWGAQHPDSWVVRHFGTAWGSLWQYHVYMYSFHTGEQMQNAHHPYGTSPWTWPVMGRTVGIYAQNSIQPGDQGCMADAGSTCLRVITALGTPLLWWAGCLALLAGLVWWLAGMDWRFGVVVLGYVPTWIFWLLSNRGAIFSFYAVAMVPFTAIALAMALGVILGPAGSGVRRRTGAIIAGSIVTLIMLDFAFIYPILTGQLMTLRQWELRMWWPGWR